MHRYIYTHTHVCKKKWVESDRMYVEKVKRKKTYNINIKTNCKEHLLKHDFLSNAGVYKICCQNLA